MIVVQFGIENSKTMLRKIFFISLIAFLGLYILRGIGFITFLPGGIITALLMTTVISGLIWGILKTSRY